MKLRVFIDDKGTVSFSDKTKRYMPWEAIEKYRDCSRSIQWITKNKKYDNQFHKVVTNSNYHLFFENLEFESDEQLLARTIVHGQIVAEGNQLSIPGLVLTVKNDYTERLISRIINTLNYSKIKSGKYFKLKLYGKEIVYLIKYCRGYFGDFDPIINEFLNLINSIYENDYENLRVGFGGKETYLRIVKIATKLTIGVREL